MTGARDLRGGGARCGIASSRDTEFGGRVIGAKGPVVSVDCDAWRNPDQQFGVECG